MSPLFVRMLFPLLLCLSATVSAADATYWVLGSFSREAGAAFERTRLSETLREQVLIAVFERDGAPLYRVVVSTALGQAAIEAKGISPWTLQIAHGRFASADVPALVAVIHDRRTDPESAVVDPGASRVVQQIAEGLVTPIPVPAGIAPGESYATHCADTSGQLRNPVCDSDEFRELQESRDRLERSRAELKRHCSTPTNAGETASRAVR